MSKGDLMHITVEELITKLKSHPPKAEVLVSIGDEMEVYAVDVRKFGSGEPGQILIGGSGGDEFEGPFDSPSDPWPDDEDSPEAYSDETILDSDQRAF